MKKVINLFLCALLLAVPLVPAQAASAEYLSISDLREQVKDGWHQTYEAYGRTIQIDLDIKVPDVEKAPVLIVQKYPEITGQRFSELERIFTAPKKDNKVSYTFLSDWQRTYFTHHYPFVLDEKNGETMLNTSWPNRSLITFDWNQAYADNNTLTVKEAYDIAVKRFQEVFGDEYQLEVQAVGLEDRYISKKTGKPIREKGGYLFAKLRQTFYGIPLFSNAKGNFFHVANYPGELDEEFFVSASIVDAVNCAG